MIKKTQWFIFIVIFPLQTTYDPFIRCAQNHLIQPNGTIDALFFSPLDKEKENIIIGLIRSSKHIIGALYLLTYKPFINEFIAAYKRGTDISFLIDSTALKNRYVQQLIQEGITVKVYSPDKYGSLMHLKTVCFQGALEKNLTIIASGSMNWTNNGLNNNVDYIEFRNNPTYVKQFSQKLSKLQSQATIQLSMGKNTQKTIKTSEPIPTVATKTKKKKHRKKHRKKMPTKEETLLCISLCVENSVKHKTMRTITRK